MIKGLYTAKGVIVICETIHYGILSTDLARDSYSQEFAFLIRLELF
jgi:hypothetical protein